MRRSRCEERLAGRDKSPYNRQKGSGKGCRGRRPRRPAGGQDPSLRINLKGVRRAACPQAAARVSGWLPVDGGHSKVAGRACPAPTDCRESSCTRGAREGGSPPLPSWRVVDREWAATQGPSESPSQLTVAAPFDKGASLAPCGGSGEHPNFKTEEGSAALRTDSNTASV